MFVVKRDNIANHHTTNATYLHFLKKLKKSWGGWASARHLVGGL